MKKRTAIDLGASTIRVLAPGSGEIVACPACVALECGSGRPISFGLEAWQCSRRMPGSVDLVYPLFEPERVTSTVLEGLFAAAARLIDKKGRFHTDLALSLPASVTPEQEMAYPEAASLLGAGDVYLVSGLHAVSRGVEHGEAGVTAVIHMGASVCEIGAYTEGQCLVSRSLPIGGRAFDDLLGDYVYDRYQLLLDSDGAEELKKRLCLPDLPRILLLSGLQRKTGLPIKSELETSVLYQVLRHAYQHITGPLLELVGVAGQSPERVWITGGSAGLPGLKQAVEECLPESRVAIADEPWDAVIRGLDAMIVAREI